MNGARVTCQPCGQWWFKAGASAGSTDTANGRDHHCTAYLGPEDYREASFKVERVKHIPDTKPHPCDRDCEEAHGTVCHCECGGMNHGMAHERRVPPPLALVPYAYAFPIGGGVGFICAKCHDSADAADLDPESNPVTHPMPGDPTHCEGCGNAIKVPRDNAMPVDRADLDRLYDRLEASEAVDFQRKRAERGKP